MEDAASIEPVSMLKSRSAKLIQIARVTKKPVVITQNGRASAVLVDAATYEEERKLLLTLQFLAAGDGEIRQGRGVPHVQARKQFLKTLKGLPHG
ncbi:MAG: type II toxin-antitoxin system prevent-host-death family antitoxin [bacterium]